MPKFRTGRVRRHKNSEPEWVGAVWLREGRMLETAGSVYLLICYKLLNKGYDCEELAKGKRLCLELESSYRSRWIIIGSVAEVGRLRSIAKYILTENRGAMTPEAFESLIFLKVNSEFLGLTTVLEAIRSIRNDGVPSATVEVNAEEN